MTEALTGPLCEELLDGYGVCSKPANHMVHQPNGISPREHKFKRPERGGQWVTVTLTKRNIKKVAHKSGTSVADLRIIMETCRIKGKTPTVRYQLPEEK